MFQKNQLPAADVLRRERGEARARQRAAQFAAAQRYYAEIGAPQMVGRA